MRLEIPAVRIDWQLSVSAIGQSPEGHVRITVAKMMIEGFFYFPAGDQTVRLVVPAINLDWLANVTRVSGEIGPHGTHVVYYVERGGFPAVLTFSPEDLKDSRIARAIKPVSRALASGV